jgi:hypothetical protein
MVTSLGNDVTIDARVDVDARGTGSGSTGGDIEVTGVDVTTESNSRVRAGAPSSGEGGRVSVVAREAMTLDGEVSADTEGEIALTYRDTAPSLGSSVDCPCGTGECAECLQTQDATLPEPCGDGIRRLGVEDCDRSDFAGASCESENLGTGSLSCEDTCTLDTTGCSGS